MKNTIKLSFTLCALLLTLATTAFAQSNNDIYTFVKLSYEVDGMDVWELPEPRTQEQVSHTIKTFKDRCAVEVPKIYYARIAALGLNADDFDVVTSSYKFYYRGYGDSHRCRMTAQIKKRDFYSFKTTKTDYYTDTNTTPAFERCKEIRDDLDLRASEINLFDRIIQIEWGRRNGAPAILGCFVTYTTIQRK